MPATTATTQYSLGPCEANADSHLSQVAVEDRPYPKIQKPSDAVLKVTSTALCVSLPLTACFGRHLTCDNRALTSTSIVVTSNARPASFAAMSLSAQLSKRVNPFRISRKVIKVSHTIPSSSQIISAPPRHSEYPADMSLRSRCPFLYSLPGMLFLRSRTGLTLQQRRAVREFCSSKHDRWRAGGVCAGSISRYHAREDSQW